MASQPPPVPPAAMPPSTPPTAKKTSPWVWVAIGCGGTILLTVLIFVIGGVFLAKKVGNFAKEAEKNPAMAVAKMYAAVNPEVEVVDSDDARGTITLRSKKTGEVVTFDVNDVKEGRIKFSTDKGEAEIRSDPGGLTLKTDRGTATFGSGGDYPDWLPAYPSANPTGTFSSQTDEARVGSWQFETDDDGAKVLGFFEKELRSKGFKITSSNSWQGGDNKVGMVMAESGKRSVMVTVGSGEGRTQVNVTVNE